MPESTQPEASLILSDGIMADRIQAHAWEATPLGALQTWSSTLIATLNLILSSPVPIQLLWGRELIVLYNDAFSQQLGLMDAEALGRPARIVWAEAWPLVEERLTATMESGAITDERGAAIPVARGGSVEETYWDFSYSPVYEKDGTIVGVLNISHDVTSGFLADRELRRTERRSDQILRSIGDAVIVTDARSCITRMNQVAELLTGWSATEAVGRELTTVFNIVHAETRRVMESPAAKALRLGRVVGFANHTILVSREGRDVHIDDSGAPILDDDGHFQGIVLVFRDVTAQREAERALEEAQQRVARSEALLHLIMDALPAYISYVDSGFRYRLVNRAYEDLLGKKAEQIVGKTIDEVLSPAAAEIVRIPLSKAFGGRCSILAIGSLRTVRLAPSSLPIYPT